MYSRRRVADQLLHLYAYIARAASPSVATRDVDAIVAYCESLDAFPYRGVQGDNIQPGLCITHYRKQAVIAFAVDAEQVSILGIYYGGRDHESLLRVESEDDPAL